MNLKTTTRIGAAVVAAGAATAAFGIATVSAATPGPRITICHATASQTNPYVRMTVAQDAADGNLGNDHGQGDHFAEHGGPIGPTADGRWGDIIAPIAGVHDGLNWTTDGQAILNNGCSIPVTTTTQPGG